MRQTLAELFTTQGYDVAQEADCGTLISRVIDVDPDVILLAQETVTLGESNDNTIQLVRRLMDGVIVVVGDAAEAELADVLLQGADIYIRKPVNFRELLARVRAFRRRIDLDDTA